ncbi:general transcription factor IIF subunit 2-like isoform X2 [Dysidea avara]
MTIASPSKQAGKPDVSFTISEATAASLGDGIKIPNKHKVLVQGVQSQCLCVFSESSSGDISAEGKVAQRAEVQPIVSKTYLDLKKRQIEDAGRPKHQVQQLKEMPRSTYKPVSDHKANIEYEEKKKEEGKRIRQDREVVLDLIFAAFQQHQYYNFKDLVGKTKQPPAYLKQILQEVCQYNTKNPHKNMWELKPEYRHYAKSTEDES